MQAARFFTIKSYKLFDSDDNLSWSQGYTPQFSSDACTLEQPQRGTLILTIKYYKRCIGGKALYFCKAENGEVYNDTWTRETIMEHCKYKFVKNELEIGICRNCKTSYAFVMMQFQKCVSGQII